MQSVTVPIACPTGRATPKNDTIVHFHFTDVKFVVSIFFLITSIKVSSASNKEGTKQHVGM